MLRGPLAPENLHSQGRLVDIVKSVERFDRVPINTRFHSRRYGSILKGDGYHVQSPREFVGSKAADTLLARETAPETR
jgi:hypothetical protein